MDVAERDAKWRVVTDLIFFSFTGDSEHGAAASENGSFYCMVSMDLTGWYIGGVCSPTRSGRGICLLHPYWYYAVTLRRSHTPMMTTTQLVPEPSWVTDEQNSILEFYIYTFVESFYFNTVRCQHKRCINFNKEPKVKI